MAKRSARVYQGRFKGSTETHIPNDIFREKYNNMNWNSIIEFQCENCGDTHRVHKLELKAFVCRGDHGNKLGKS